MRETNKIEKRGGYPKSKQTKMCGVPIKPDGRKGSNNTYIVTTTTNMNEDCE